MQVPNNRLSIIKDPLRYLLSALQVIISIFAFSALAIEQDDPKLTEVWTPIPAQVRPAKVPNGPPSDAIVLFDGSDLSEWQHWDKTEPKWTLSDGVMTVKPGSKGLQTKRKFCDMQLHLEWRSPALASDAKNQKKGQQLGNSGIYLQNKYEVQILNSYNNQTYANGQAASVYKQSPPLVNASLAPMQWQTYEIIYRAPRFAASGEIITPAAITLLHNGVLVQNHFELAGPTKYRGKPNYDKAHGCDSFYLQDHGNTVSFRNIWVREL